MSANYWTSSQNLFWKFSQEEVKELRDLSRKAMYNDNNPNSHIELGDFRFIRIYLHQITIHLGKVLNLRQQVIATSEVYLMRFLLSANIREINPYAIITSCLYLAAKTEEIPINIKTIATEAHALWPEYIPSLNDAIILIAECEFYLIEALDSCFIVHQPYKFFRQFIDSIAAPFGINELKLAWSIISDSFITDLNLMYAPHEICISALFLATINSSSNDSSNINGNSNNSKILSWITSNGFKLENIMACVQELISLYAIWQLYNEKSVYDLIAFILTNK